MPLTDEEREEIEAQLIAQEHRLIRVITNFWTRGKYLHGDKRYRACIEAAVWRMFAPASVAIAGGGLIAAGTLMILIWQTEVMRQANELIAQQTLEVRGQLEAQQTQISLQRAQFEEQRAAENVRRRSEILEQLTTKDNLKSYDIVQLAIGAIGRADSPSLLTSWGQETMTIGVAQTSSSLREALFDEMAALDPVIRAGGLTLEECDLTASKDMRLWEVNMTQSKLSVFANSMIMRSIFQGTDVLVGGESVLELRACVVTGATIEGSEPESVTGATIEGSKSESVLRLVSCEVEETKILWCERIEITKSLLENVFIDGVKEMEFTDTVLVNVSFSDGASEGVTFRRCVLVGCYFGTPITDAAVIKDTLFAPAPHDLVWQRKLPPQRIEVDLTGQVPDGVRKEFEAIHRE